MFKDDKYFRQMDLQNYAEELAALRIRSSEATDQQMEMLGDMINAIILRYKTERFTEDDLSRLIGPPTRKERWQDAVVWYYGWYGYHGKNRYCSETPFVLKESMVVGILVKGNLS